MADLEEKSVIFQNILSFIENKDKVLCFDLISTSLYKQIQSKKCHITTVHENQQSIESHNPNEIIVNEYEKFDFKIIPDSKFDKIILINFLDRIDYPLKFLINIKSKLATNGKLICSLPNSAHGANRIRMLNGELGKITSSQFSEKSKRQFTLTTILALFYFSEYSIDKLLRGKKDLDINEYEDLKEYSITDELIDSIKKDPESDTTDFIFSAIKKQINQNPSYEWIMDFHNTITTDRLKEWIGYYKEYLYGLQEQKIKDLENKLKQIQNEND